MLFLLSDLSVLIVFILSSFLYHSRTALFRADIPKLPVYLFFFTPIAFPYTLIGSPWFRFFLIWHVGVVPADKMVV